MSDINKKDLLEKIKDEIKKTFEDFEETEIVLPEIDNVPDYEEEEEPEKRDRHIKVLPMIPLRGICVFPEMVLHFDIGREKSIKALEQAMIADKQVFLATQKDEDTELPTAEDFYEVGTIAKVKQMLRLSGEVVRVLVEGVSRAEIESIVEEVPYFKCKVREIEKVINVITPRISAMIRSINSRFEEYVSMSPKLSSDLVSTVSGIGDPNYLADIIASHLPIKIEEKHEILSCYPMEERLIKVSELLSREIEIISIEQDISVKLKDAVNKHQKEFYLREQMKVIQDELGIAEDAGEEAQEWLKKLKKLKLSPKISEKVEREIKRFERLSTSSPESNIIRTYVDTILNLPWNKSSKADIDLKKAENILDEDHYGLEKVKERVLEYLAVIELSAQIKGPILCLVGPPGVGKTSIAKSIARATNREFVRMSLGGVRDEAEIRGHRRTYVGAIPGRVIAGIKDAGTNNPLFLFDEIDKIGSDFKGDPASALLEVLDPEQNKEFSDHYLEIPFDLSKVMFITTANAIDTIPRPLLDRMEVINVSGYTEEEKLKIAERYLIPKKMREHGLADHHFFISEGALRDIINYYTRESGVRNLERQIANICRKVAKKVVQGEDKTHKINTKNLENFLGKKKYRYDIIEGESEVGVVTGMAWTAVGGDTLFIETSCVDGKGRVELTGKLGDVMKESAKTGLSYVRSISDRFGIPNDFFDKKDFHIHVPEGATPKDGPSAGVTMCTAMISTLTGKPVKKSVAMTGEITLRGKILPVGGIKEKVLAAHRAGVSKILLPVDNERDVEDIPVNVRKKLDIVLISNVDDALREALVEG